MICPACQSENIAGADECEVCGGALYGLQINNPGGPAFIHRPLSEMKKRPIHAVGIADPVAKAVQIMQREDTNCVLVKDGNRTAGIITGWDVLQKVAGPGVDLVAVTCEHVMTPDPYFLDEDDSIALALNAMAVGGFRHVPVEQDGKATGIINAPDLFRYISPHLV